jgi:phage tail-like protein
VTVSVPLLAGGTPHRGAIPGLASPFPLVNFTPGMLADDALVQLLLEALDEVLAPAISTLDCMDAYLDPDLAPIDMVKYLASWLLAEVDDEWDEGAVRRDVRQAHARAKWAGTSRAIRERLVPNEVESLEIVDSGSTTATLTPTDPSQWEDPPAVEVTLRVRPRRSEANEVKRIERLARGLVPAHVTVTVVDSR